MKVITHPTVQVVGHSVFIEHPKYKIPGDGTDAEKIGAFAAKGCYDSYGRGGRSVKDNQREIIKHRHGSVMEHATATLFVEGVTRALTLEMNRHRHLAISQRSTRYTKEEDSAIVLEPFYADIYERQQANDPDLTDSESLLLDNFISSADKAFVEYRREVEALEAQNPNGLVGFDLRKWARGKARNILPHALETRATYTSNYRSWRHIIEVRSSRHAEPEIRRLANSIIHTLREFAPIYFEDFKNNGIYGGIPEWIPEYSKV